MKLVPELSERRTTVIRTFGSLSSGFSARIAGSFHAVILPRKMSASVLRSSRSAFGFTPRRLTTTTTPPVSIGNWQRPALSSSSLVSGLSVPPKSTVLSLT